MTNWRTSSGKRCGALRVWNRALKHLDRSGANNHELYRVVRAASDAEHALRVLALYERIDSEKRAENGKPGGTPKRQRCRVGR